MGQESWLGRPHEAQPVFLGRSGTESWTASRAMLGGDLSALGTQAVSPGLSGSPFRPFSAPLDQEGPKRAGWLGEPELDAAASLGSWPLRSALLCPLVEVPCDQRCMVSLCARVVLR